MFNTSGNCIDFVEKLTNLLVNQAEWSQATFGTDATRGPWGPLDHLTKEAVEASKAADAAENKFGSDEYAELRKEFLLELADCQLLLYDAMRRGGFRLGELVGACCDKMVINKARKWPAPGDPKKAVEHVKEKPDTSRPCKEGETCPWCGGIHMGQTYCPIPKEKPDELPPDAG